MGSALMLPEVIAVNVIWDFIQVQMGKLVTVIKYILETILCFD